MRAASTSARIRLMRSSLIRPTVVGIFSGGGGNCRPGLDYYVFLTAPATLRFIRAST